MSEQATLIDAHTAPPEQIVHLSPAALTRVRELVAADGNAGKMLRLTVDGGGCSGFQYSFAFDAQTGDDDRVFDHDGVKVVTDEASLELLAGCTVDFVENPGAAYFKIDNPNATSSCGCGMSFAI